MTSLTPSRQPFGRWIPPTLALTVAVVSGCGLVGDPADPATPSPLPVRTPPPAPLPDEIVPELPCPAETRRPETVEVDWPAAAAAHRAAGPHGTSVLATGCPPVQLVALTNRRPGGGS
ncbi:hypothetical protein [Streptomyces sp. NPDC059649]|uniref:hypothetical protein n=1 Tax=Streptomyces sp. NPDC059649 TaxID=3346895 RepID=UPI0036BBA3EC